MLYDPYFLLLIPAFILAIYAQIKVRNVYAKYSRVPAWSGYTGMQTAREILDRQGLEDVPVEEVRGFLSDHYDPLRKVLRLSPAVYRGRSLASVGIAAHEAGHAIQHARMYVPLMVRTGIFPVASFGSWISMPLFFIGFLFGHPLLMDLGIIIFTSVVAFQVITLPVEFNASKRAVKLLYSEGIISEDEIQPTKEVLNAAALTYLAAVAVAIMHLVRLLLLRGERR